MFPQSALLALALSWTASCDLDVPSSPASSLEGAWRAAGGRTELTCGEQTLVVPVVSWQPLVVEPLADGQLQATAPSGCTLRYAITDDDAGSAEAGQTCETMLPSGPATQVIDASTLVLRAPDELLYEAWGTVETEAGACTVHASAQLTREEALAEGLEVAVVDTFDPGTFLESVERDAAGNTYVSALAPDGAGHVVRIAADGGRTELFAYPPGGFGTLVLDDQGVLYGTVVPLQPDPSVPRGIVRIEPDGTSVTLAELPSDAAPNGITMDAAGNLYVADSALGVVWRLPAGAGAAEVWADGELLAVPPALGFPGPNGIKVFEGEVYVSNPAQLTFVRIPILDDGSAGLPALHAVGVPCDDFALDVEGNLYATTHPFNSLVQVRPSGEVRALLTSEHHMWGPTAAIFDEGSEGGSRLLVVTDGNVFGAGLPPSFQESAELQPAEVVALDVGIAGAPVPGA